jgi:hypothetical protein|tara:strand:- start:4391 stop:5191 length:801 start_codon:yes stop_codon:yes gene_type:complete
MTNKTTTPVLIETATPLLSNRPVFEAGKAIASQDSRDTTARLKIFIAMKAGYADAVTLGKDGDHFADLRDGYLIAWQGQTFADKFAVANGKVELKGKVINRLTGAKVTETKSRAAWQRDLGSKVTKARESYLAWLGVEAEAEAQASADGSGKAPTSGAATKAGQGAPRDLNVRIADELCKLSNAIGKDKDSDAPKLKSDHKELLAAFNVTTNLVNGKVENVNVAIGKAVDSIFGLIKNDHLADKPRLKADHKELLAAFARIADLIK